MQSCPAGLPRRLLKTVTGGSGALPQSFFLCTIYVPKLHAVNRDSARGKTFPLHVRKALDDTEVHIAGKAVFVCWRLWEPATPGSGSRPPACRQPPRSKVTPSATTLSTAHRHSGKRLARQAGSGRRDRLRQKPPRGRRPGGSTGVGQGPRHRAQDRSSFFCVTASLSCSLRFLQSR